MCLAVPGKIIECTGDEALIDLHGNRHRISTVLTPEATVGDWVLAHAGFAISLIGEAEALETWEWLRTMSADSPLEAAGTQSPDPRE
jgi:hydrogenase expression/formation protein HypC